MLYGGRFLTEDAPDGPFPQTGMAALDAQRLVEEELQLEGDPNRNLATFVTTSMEPEAKQLIYDNNYRNFIDHAEYPISAEIEQRCIRMLADLYHAPGETTGASTLRPREDVCHPTCCWTPAGGVARRQRCPSSIKVGHPATRDSVTRLIRQRSRRSSL